MCRSIKDLRSLSGEPASEPKDTEIQEAALQFVRKISGDRKPSVANTSALSLIMIMFRQLQIIPA